MIKTIDLCGTWQIKGATSYRGGYFDWPTKEQPFVPSYPAKVPGTVQEAFEHITGNLIPRQLTLRHVALLTYFFDFLANVRVRHKSPPV